MKFGQLPFQGIAAATPIPPLTKVASSDPSRENRPGPRPQTYQTPTGWVPRSKSSPRSRNPKRGKTCPSPQTAFCLFMIVPRAGPLLPNQGDIRYSGGGCRKAENERTQEIITSQDRHAAIEPPLRRKGGATSQREPEKIGAAGGFNVQPGHGTAKGEKGAQTSRVYFALFTTCRREGGVEIPRERPGSPLLCFKQRSD